MSCVYVLHESVDWYGPLDRALTQADLPHREIFLSSGALDLTQPQVAEHLPRMGWRLGRRREFWDWLIAEWRKLGLLPS